MRRGVLLLNIVLIPLFAQSPSQQSAEPEAWLLPFTCAYQPDIGEFNNRFRDRGIPTARTRHYGWGVEIRSLVGKDFLTGPIFFRTQDIVTNETIQLRTETTALLMMLGLKLPLFRFLTVVPMLALGGVQPGFQIMAKSGEIALDSLLTLPGQMTGLSPGLKLTGLAALELNLLIPTNSGNYGISLRGGYLYSPFVLNWRLPSGARVTGTPDTKIRGPWFSLGITIIPAPEVTTVQ